jgi:hypothetical protein
MAAVTVSPPMPESKMPMGRSSCRSSMPLLDAELGLHQGQDVLALVVEEHVPVLVSKM